MYQYQPMMNDFCQRPVSVYGQHVNFPPQPQTPQVTSRFVTNIEEARAAMIDPFSCNLFLDSGSGKIYLKKLSNNGQSEFLTYSVEDNAQKEKRNPIDEINERLSNIENFLGGMRNDKSVSGNADDKQSYTGPAIHITESDGAVAERESAGFPKNAGNDKWKKR